MDIAELDLPKSSLMKIVKNNLPQGTHVSKDAKMAMIRCATVWVNYLTACSLDSAPTTKKDQTKRVTVDAITKSLETVEMQDFIGVRLEERMKAWKVVQQAKKDSKKQDSGKDIVDMETGEAREAEVQPELLEDQEDDDLTDEVAEDSALESEDVDETEDESAPVKRPQPSSRSSPEKKRTKQDDMEV